jgi:hypothetical protein
VCRWVVKYDCIFIFNIDDARYTIYVHQIT